ncbi:MAG: hypothetical protein IIA89_06640 [Chloroflexi bacterium]|nr:hypothetical protein [Chloroflexota bacterium]
MEIRSHLAAGQLQQIDQEWRAYPPGNIDPFTIPIVDCTYELIPIIGGSMRGMTISS